MTSPDSAAPPPPDDGPGSRPRRRRRAVSSGAALVAAAAAASVVVLRPDGTTAAVSSPGFSYVRAELATLVDSTNVSGRLGFDDSHPVTAARAGTLTERPADGTEMRRGQAVYRIDDEPVILLYGEMPMYRELAVGVDDGPDVRQLEDNLEALGYAPGTVNEKFGDRTASAVREWQDDLGLRQTGTVAPGQVLFRGGPLRAGTSAARPGDTVAPGAPLFTATSTTRVVTVDLDAGSSSLAVVGSAGTVTLPDGRRTGVVTREVGSTATPAASGAAAAGAEPSATATLPLTLSLDTPADVGTLVSAPVTVALTREQKADVVAVPVTALVARSDGSYAVRVQDPAQPSGYRLTPVGTGLHASGQVEITTGLTAGQPVGVPT